MFIEGSLACLATDINEMLYLYLTFLVEPSVSDTQTVAPTCPYFVGGGGGLAKYEHARFLANAEIYGRSLTMPQCFKFLPRDEVMVFQSWKQRVKLLPHFERL